MFMKKPLVVLIGSLMGGLVATQVHAAPDNESLMRELQQLAQRVAQLETANRNLEKALEQGADSKADENGLVSRLEDVESEVIALQGKPSGLKALDGVSAGASLVAVAQRATSGTTDGKSESQLNYRADVEVELPGGSIGDAEGKIFAQFRLGQGNGLGMLNPTLTGSVNSTAFQLAGGTDDSVALLAQAWYQLDIPVGAGKSGELGRFEVTAGKIDPFVFFDGNNIADDESEAFLNNVFVHNPLLDSGGDAGVDAYGFTPGARMAYTSDVNGSNNWGVSLGMFGSGPGTHFDGSFTKPFLIAQAEYNGKTWDGLDGAYRFYTWSNGRATALDAVTEERHAGWGLSIDQQVAKHVTLFTRLGHSTQGEVAFDRAFTVGAQLGGSAWGRDSDRIGLAMGWLNTSDEYQLANPGFSGAEKQAELYYAWQLNHNLQISPSAQWIDRPAGDPAADNITVLSLRAKASF